MPSGRRHTLQSISHTARFRHIGTYLRAAAFEAKTYRRQRQRHARDVSRVDAAMSAMPARDTPPKVIGPCRHSRA